MRYTVYLLMAGLGLMAVALIASGIVAQGQAGPELPPITPVVLDTPDPVTSFDGERAYEHLLTQMDFGPRYPGSTGHIDTGNWIGSQLTALGWTMDDQRFTYHEIDGRNIIARANEGAGPIVVIGAHYDTRRIADQTPGSSDPVPGAVDGASGVAVLVELARSLDLADIPREIWLVFFDMEDNGGGGIEGWEYIVGSRYMAANLSETIDAMIVVDLVGDADQQIYLEGFSDPDLSGEVWSVAAGLGYGDAIIGEYRHTVNDDHVPFARLGVPAVLMIDMDYPYWHTVEDTADKASTESLQRVGRTIEAWLEVVLE